MPRAVCITTHVASIDVTTTGYPGRPLESESHIRLLKILPGRLACSLSCELIHASIDQTPPYEAVSYVWGDPEPQNTIFCNGRDLDVGRSLGSALYRLRFYENERLLWIDAICIDQGSVQEKNAQLPLMRKIYQQAKEVLIWIGPEDDGRETAMSLIPNLIDVYNTHKSMRDIHEQEQEQKSGQDWASRVVEEIKREMLERTSTKVTRNGLILDAEEERAGLPPLHSPKWECLNALYNAPWFHRVWTIQEMIVAENVELVYGESSCSWDHFCYAAYCMERSLLPSAPVHCRNAVWLDFQRSQFHKEGSLSLLTLLNECHERHATQQHDKVYALLGLVENQEDIYKEHSLLKPDYGLAVETVYRRLAVHSLTVQREPNILRAVHQTRVHTGLPTWVPDWSGARPKPFLSAVHTWYRAGGDIEGTTLPTATLFASDQNVLIVKGKLYDTILRVGSAMAIQGDDPSSGWTSFQERYRECHQCLAVLTLCWREWRELARIDEEIPYPGTNESRENAYWRTLIGDSSSDDFAAPADAGYRYNYKQWRNHMRRAQQGFFSGPSAADWAASPDVGHLPMPDADIVAVLQGRMNDPYFKSFYERNISAAALLRFAITAKGYFALMPSIAEPGDAICVVPGVKTPMLLRRDLDTPDELYNLLGACFVHGIMNGEALGDSDQLTFRDIMIK